MANLTPILVTGSFTPSGTQDVSIVSQAITLAISAASLPLPTGASTETTLLAVKTDLDKFTFTATRLLVDGSGVVQPISGTITANQGTSPWIISGAVSASQSGTWNINNVSGIVSLPTGAATETTLSAIKTDTDKFTFASTRLLIDGSGVTQPISGTVSISGTIPISGTVSATQSGTWTTGRTWTLASGTDSIAAVQSGTWNLNNISGTISLPTGAATEATLSSLNGKVTTVNTGAVTISTALPSGTNVIGHVITDTGSTTSVSNFPATQPVSGTVAATQSGTWTVQPGNTANTTAWKVDGSAVTQPISAASLPLPSGASTSAKQPALGTAGTASADVLTVQGIASMTPLKTDGSGTTQPISGTVTANIGTTNGLALDATLTGGTQKTKLVDTGGTNVASVSAAGALKVDGSAATQPISGTVTAIQATGTNLHAVIDSGSTTAVTGNVTVIQPTGSNLHVVNDASSAVIGHVITDTGSTIVVTGNVTVVQPTGTNLHTVVDNNSVSTATVTTVTVGPVVVTLLASRAARLLAVIFNETGTLYIKAGSAASSTDYTWRLTANTELDISHYTGIVTATKASGTSTCQVTDF